MSAAKTLQLSGPAAINSEAAIARPANIPDQMPSGIQDKKENVEFTIDDFKDVINPIHHLQDV